MNRHRFLTLVLVLVLLAAFAGPAHAAPKFDLVAGSGKIADAYGSPFVHINVKSVGVGSAQGMFRIVYPKGSSRYPEGGSLTGHAVCLWVAGNTAYVIVSVDSSTLPVARVGQYVVIGILDGKNYDLLNFSPGLDAKPACGPSTQAIPNLPLVNGGLNVQEAK